ncbi:MAG: hypothetical protein D6784_17965 [Chloroflexi bacterium]|nr:MAG: hypothetical protein D6784_17965 [Chloroflexota bacterium]
MRHYDRMPPFFMSLVSSADHWLFIASTGGLTAGRINADFALFPYETDDKITAHSDITGSKTIFRVSRGGKTFLWEPFSPRYAGLYFCERNIYKNVYGNKLVFEEINHDLQLTFRYSWRTSNRFGFVRTGWLTNHDNTPCQVEMLDGLLNILPYGATAQLQTAFSNLVNAYKRSEIEPKTGLGIFSLSATPTDRAEPSESLKATVAWQAGLDSARYLLCADQLDAFRHGWPVSAEQDVRGKPGAYLAHTILTLEAGQTQNWYIVADVNQDSRQVANLLQQLQAEGPSIIDHLEADIDHDTAELVKYVASADGLQVSADRLAVSHHFSNVLFNIMRGGIFADGYTVHKADLLAFVRTRNRPVLAAQAGWFDALPEKINIRHLYERTSTSPSADLARLCREYLPLFFSRRHGDPSRPWNRFSINLTHPDGSPRLDFQGNWRDIFQNWEPLAYAFPAYVEGMIARFLNATTADGYNPYRVTRDGIEWEIPEPENPWANIGYWNDHQIIYLQKFLEFAEQVHPGMLASLWNRPIFSYANVPYRLRPYREMLADWYNTVDFDWELEEAIEAAVADFGTDARLLRGPDGAVIHATMAEKLLVLLLVKLTNLVPEGGIWMNTQRPEWNDANNALAGKGLSVVTTAYLRRFIDFWLAQLASAETTGFSVNSAVAELFARVHTVLAEWQSSLQNGFTPQTRRAVMDALGEAATAYRHRVYSAGLPPEQVEMPANDLRRFLALAQEYIEQTLRANRRPDGLYHAYNVLHLEPEGVAVDHLYLMLEGQVAILSSGMLSPDEAVTLLHSLRHSELYRPDQHTYMLYPNRSLPGFLQKNNIPADRVAGSALVAALTAAGDQRLIIRDNAGNYHFNGTFRNAGDVAQTLQTLAQEPAYAPLVEAEKDFMLDLFEEVFNHRAFTGRSGTFFAFEGLGSVYWHMVSKLLLAAQECYLSAVANAADERTVSALAEAYYDIRQGLGFNKTPAQYGAFPTDPYSHTPAGSGARQPGMTGQVKEEILTRLGELGVSVRQGKLCFNPALLRPSEFIRQPARFEYVDLRGSRRALPLPPDSLAFTICQTPVIYTRGDAPQIELFFADGRRQVIEGTRLDPATSRHIFDRDGYVRLVQVKVRFSALHGASTADR